MTKKNITQKYIPLAITLFVFAFIFFFDTSAPGIYYDAINPDYQAVKILSGDTQYINHFQPWSQFPILGQLYHGVMHTYIAIPFFHFLGINIISLRLAQGLFAFLILIFIYILLKRQTNALIAFIFTLLLAIDPVFHYAFKTQGYITLSPLVFVLVAIYLLNNDDLKIADFLKVFFVGLLVGLAVYGYFFYLFFLPAFLVHIGWRQRNLKHILWFLLGSFLSGGLLFIYGYVQIISAVGFEKFIYDYSISSASYSQGLIETARKLLSRAFSGVNGSFLYGTIFSEEHDFFFNALKVCILIFLSMLSFFIKCRQRSFCFFIFSLIFSFFFFSFFMKGKIGAHHSLFNLVLLYLLAGVGFSLFFDRWKDFSKNTRFILIVFSVAVIFIFLLINLFFQVLFLSRLKETGGVNYYSNAIAVLASDAVSNRNNRFYIFPDWGFSAPFLFYTANRVRFSQELDPENIEKKLCTEDVAIVTWYHLHDRVSILISNFGFKYRLINFQSRDGKPSIVMFYLNRKINRLVECGV